MTRKLLPIALLLALLAWTLAPAGAQEAQPKPEFDNAPVTDVLLWAQKSMGVGFIYEGDVLNDPGTKQIRKVTARHVEPVTKPEKTLLLFELLKRCGLVPFEVGGMPGPTYHLYAAEGAARNAVIVNSPEELHGMYFASLTIQFRRAGVQAVAPRVREILTEGIGSIEVFEDTHSLIVCDFTDRLLAAWEIAMSAENPPDRDDDLIVADHIVRTGTAERAIAAVERLREQNETWKATINAPANALLISGRRDQIDVVLERLSLLDKHEENAAFTENTQTIKLIYLTPAEAVATLRDMFEAKVGSGAVQIGGFVRDRKVVFRGSDYDFERAKAAIRAIDSKPETPEKK